MSEKDEIAAVELDALRRKRWEEIAETAWLAIALFLAVVAYAIGEVANAVYIRWVVSW